MTQLTQLKLMNDTMILYLKNIGMNYRRNEIIKEILNDEACFFKIEKEDAYIILKDIGVTIDKLEETYWNLISTAEFYNLLNAKKINENDKELKIKYKTYNSNDIFKKRELVKEETKNKSMLVEVKKENLLQKLINKIKKILHIH